LTEKVAAAIRDLAKWIRELQEERFVETVDIERISRSLADVEANAGFHPEDQEDKFGTEQLSKRPRKSDV
jgi:Sec-independent protein translocase protein TatA